MVVVVKKKILNLDFAVEITGLFFLRRNFSHIKEWTRPLRKNYDLTLEQKDYLDLVSSYEYFASWVCPYYGRNIPMVYTLISNLDFCINLREMALGLPKKRAGFYDYRWLVLEWKDMLPPGRQVLSGGQKRFLTKVLSTKEIFTSFVTCAQEAPYRGYLYPGDMEKDPYAFCRGIQDLVTKEAKALVVKELSQGRRRMWGTYYGVVGSRPLSVAEVLEVEERILQQKRKKAAKVLLEAERHRPKGQLTQLEINNAGVPLSLDQIVEMETRLASKDTRQSKRRPYKESTVLRRIATEFNEETYKSLPENCRERVEWMLAEDCKIAIVEEKVSKKMPLTEEEKLLKREMKVRKKRASDRKYQKEKAARLREERRKKAAAAEKSYGESVGVLLPF